jgi:dTDP-4-amino-4,6-dideoxygalactose transaminase
MEAQPLTAPAPGLVGLIDRNTPAEDLEAVAGVLRSGWLTMGPRTDELELELAGRIGAGHAIAASSVSATLHLALLALGVAAGHEVLVSAVGGAGAAAVVSRIGAIPVPVDVVGAADPTMDASGIAPAAKPRTRAAIVVHVGGLPADVPGIVAACAAEGIPLIEMVPGHLGATVDDAPLGSFGAIGCLALLPGGAGGGDGAGALVTSDEALAAFARTRRSHAMTSGTWARHTGATTTYDVEGTGFNYRIDEMRSVLALGQLRRLGRSGARRATLAATYADALDGAHGLKVVESAAPGRIATPDVATIVLDHAGRRPRLIGMLAAAGIATKVPASVPALRTAPPTPRADHVADAILGLPLHAGLTGEEVRRVAAIVVEALRDGAGA